MPKTATMSAPAHVLEEALKRYHAIDQPPELDTGALSPELILVLPPEEARAAREQLPEREPFDEWLERLREREHEELEPDWEFEEATPRSRLGGVLFAAACVANAAIPVVLFLIVR